MTDENTETQEPVRIDLDLARTLLKQAMETQGPAFKYNNQATISFQCYNVPIKDIDSIGYKESNFDNDDPRRKTGCLIGTAFKLGGVPYEVLQGRYDSDVSVFSKYLTSEAQAYFGAAQSAQDVGDTWGMAYERAEAYIKQMGWVS